MLIDDGVFIGCAALKPSRHAPCHLRVLVALFPLAGTGLKPDHACRPSSLEF